METKAEPEETVTGSVTGQEGNMTPEQCFSAEGCEGQHAEVKPQLKRLYLIWVAVWGSPPSEPQR